MASAYVKYVEPGESIQVAYDSLPFPAADEGGGTVFIMPGRYDLGTGLILDRRKAATFTSIAPRARRFLPDFLFGNTNQPHPTLYSSGTPNFLVASSSPTTAANGSGFVFRGLSFEMSSGKSAIMGDCVSHALVEDCHFARGSWAIELGTGDEFNQGAGSHGDDASHWRIYNNVCQGVGLLKTRGAGTIDLLGGSVKNYSHNNLSVRDNVVYGTLGSLYGVDRSSFINNNQEGGSSSGAFQLDRCFRNTFIGNGGEASGDGLKWMVLDRCNGNYLADIGHRNTLTNYTLYHFRNGSVDNIVVAPTWGADSITHNPTLDFGGISDDAAPDAQWFIRQGAHHIGTAE